MPRDTLGEPRSFRLGTDTWEKLRKIAEYEKDSQARIVRTLIDRRYAEFEEHHGRSRSVPACREA